MQLERRYSRVAMEELQSPVLRQIIGVWEAKRSGRAYPSRNELRPHDFVPFLRHLSLARVIDGGRDFEIRILGDEIVQSYGENLTGRTLSSIAAVVGRAMADAYHAVLRERGPVLLQGTFERTSHHHFRREVVLLPLGSDDRVEFVLSAGLLLPRNCAIAHERTTIDAV